MKISAKLLLLCLFLSLFSIVSCGPGVEYNSLTQTGVVKPSDCPIDIFMPGDILPPNYHRIGMIDIGENLTGTSMSCGQKTVIEELKKRACAEGADVVQIYKIKPPSMASTCYRMSAYFFTNPPKVRNTSPKQTTSQSPPSVELPAKINASKGSPDIHFDEFSISPKHVRTGGKFQLTVRYTASDFANKPDEYLPITFYYEILNGDDVLFKSKSRDIQSPNNQSTFALNKYSIKANKKGNYLLKVYLWYGDAVRKMSKKSFIIE